VSKIAVLGDTHFGMRNDSPAFHDLYSRFYREVFFPTLKSRGIESIVQTGDLFDRRKFINFNSLTRAREYFFDGLHDNGMHMTTYLGNHDIYYKNTTKINSPKLLLHEYERNHRIHILEEPTCIDYDGVDIDFIPWITPENNAQVKDFIAKSTGQICFGHFELTGFQMEAGVVCHEGMSREELGRYDMVISGHFHHRSTDGHIFYVGSPGEMTWGDYGDPRGFHIFDTATRTLEFIENPFKMFYKIEYDDTNESMDTIDNKDYAEYAGTYVKVVVKKKSNMLLFDRFIDNFHMKGMPIELGIVEDFTDYTKSNVEVGVDQAEHTLVLMDKYVDGLEMSLDNGKLKTVMRVIYNKANGMEMA
jgi:DNA repair exonuclease SbcCD nuclease subunit